MICSAAGVFHPSPCLRGQGVLFLMQFLVVFLVPIVLWDTSVLKAAQPTKQPSLDFDGLKALKHTDVDVRLNAAQLLCDLGPIAKIAVPALQEQLKVEKNAVVRVKMAEALWKVEKPAARTLLPVLIEAMTDKEPGARANAANVIGQIGAAAKSAVPELAKLLTDKDLTVRAEAAMALGEIGPAAKSAVPALLETLKGAEAFLLEPFVLGTLGKIGEDAVPHLKAALTAKEIRLRRGAAYSLGLIGPAAADATGALEMLLNAPEADLRAVAARSLGKIGKEAKATLPALQKQLKDEETAPRIEAAVALWHIGGDGAGLPVVVVLLKDARVKVREHSCRALAELAASTQVPAPALEACLKDEAPSVRVLAGEALGKMGSAAATALPALRQSFKDNVKSVAITAAVAVWRIDAKAKDVVPALTSWLADKDPNTRKAAAVALGEIGPNALPAWEKLLELYREDDVIQVQRAAGIALRQIDLKAAVKAGVH
jgi:HEAT repeat protein